jgi:hypothetical protein
MFFCIISWSRPVIAMTMNIPPKICFRKNAELFTSVLKIFVIPWDDISAITPSEE